MGAAPSSPSADAHSPPALALHVLRVAPGSPAAKTSLEPFFDFIIGVSGFDASSADITQDAALDELEALVARGLLLELGAWSSKTREKRLVLVEPSHDNGHHGLSMRVCRPGHAHDNVWHVLDVLEGSPAESAGLVPFGDWIVGWSGGPLCAESDLYEVVEAHLEKPLRVYVYSYDFDTLREVVLVPNRQWGGEGLLGCVFGFGILHRIPVVPTSASAHNTAVFRPSSTAPASESSGSAVLLTSERDEDFVY